MKVLITGANGFVGSHFSEYCLNKNFEVHGIIRDHRSSLENIEDIKDKIILHYCDLLDAPSLYNLFKNNKFDYVIHFAAKSFVTTSWDNPITTLQTNIIGTANLLEAIRYNNMPEKIAVVSSSEVYGQVSKEDIPINENCPFRPSSPYAVSKVGEDMVAYQNWVSFKMPIVRSRLFTKTGPRRGEVFFVSAFAKQIAEIKLGLRDNVIKVGNLDSIRTICDVRDAVEAYWLLLTECPSGEVYNIGGNQTKKVGEILDMMCELAEVKPVIEKDPKLLRPSDVTLQIPCTDKFKQATGWEPKIPLEQTLKDTITYWIEKLKKSNGVDDEERTIYIQEEIRP